MKKLSMLILAPAIIWLSGCASTGGDTSSEAETMAPVDSNELQFTDVDVYFTDLNEDYLRTGDLVEADQLDQITTGTSVTEVSNLLGDPKHTVTLDQGDSWEYFINLPLTESDEIVCQYKVVFDSDMNVAETHWRRHQCESIYQQLPRDPKEVMTLSADVLFAFDSAELSFEGERTLDDVADVLINDYEQPEILVVGHTDRIGSDDYNQDLSERRAESVGSYLAERGVPLYRIRQEGRGRYEPVVHCPATEVTDELKICLAPNRRVDIEVEETAAE